jgi:hypothetical protein
LRTKTILDAKGRLTAPATNYHVGTPALCNFAHFPKFKSRVFEGSRGTVRTSCIGAGDITIRIDERHVSDFAQYPPGLRFTMEPCGGAAAGLPDQEDAK